MKMQIALITTGKETREDQRRRNRQEEFISASAPLCGRIWNAKFPV
jgi:hypothetical protein